MRQFNVAAALLTAAVLTACGGGGAGDQSTKVKFSSQVSFGDSLSDVGTYAVGGIKAAGGGKYTVNSPTAKNWTEVVAAQLGLPAPCPAQTGLNGSAAYGLSVPVTDFSNCTGYAQGGARVTDPDGPGNARLGGDNAILGQLTVPVVAQIQNHLTAHGGAFKGDEVVFVMAGGNDVFINLATLQAGAAAASDPVAYVQAHAPEAVQAMGVAGAQLAGYVNNLIVGKGAKYVVVINLPDVSKSPASLKKDAATQGLINTMVTTFNAQLSGGLGSNSNIVYVDAYTVGRDESANPAQYGLSNVVDPACDLTKGFTTTALDCSTATLRAGVDDKYLFADTTGHMTPYGYELLAKLVMSEMAKKGWL